MTIQFLKRYEPAILSAGLSIYCFLLSIDYVLNGFHYIMGGLFLAGGFWYLSNVEERIKGRARVEAAAREIAPKLQAYREQGYVEDAALVEDLLIKKSSGMDYAFGVLWWVLGIVIIYQNAPHIFAMIAGGVMAACGVLVLAIAPFPDNLIT